jgi:hypothetical protein
MSLRQWQIIKNHRVNNVLIPALATPRALHKLCR